MDDDELRTISSCAGRWNSANRLERDVKPHAYDPEMTPELFEGVLPRRIIAFIIDLIIIAVPLVAASVFIFVLGLVTFGLGWALFWLLSPASVIWALVLLRHHWAAPPRPQSACARWSWKCAPGTGRPPISCSARFMPIAFWISVSVLTPFILPVGFFNDPGRLLHDILVGTVIINNANRASGVVTRPAGPPDPEITFDGRAFRLANARGAMPDSVHGCFPQDTALTQHPRDTPQFYLTAPSPCPYLAGQGGLGRLAPIWSASGRRNSTTS